MQTETSANTETERKGRRVTIDLTPAAASEVDRLRAITGLTTADVFRHAMTMLRIYVDAKAHEKEVRVVDPSRKDADTRLEFPMTIAKSES